MRLYHFVSAQHGLDDIRKRRLKVATFPNLNDPFELFSIDLSNAHLRKAFNALKDQLSTTRGILCFSRKWSNPVLWSHYADCHRGICLGFDCPDNKVGAISYSRKRLIVELENFVSPNRMALEKMQELLFTKYSHWKYENEVRAMLL